MEARKFLGVIVSLLVMIQGAANASSVEAATAVGDAYWIGEVDFDCNNVPGLPGMLDCEVDGYSTLCKEAVLGVPLGGNCHVSFRASLRISVGRGDDSASVCLGIGEGNALIESQAGDFHIEILIGAAGTGGGFSGYKTSLPTAQIWAVWESICNDQADGVVAGRYSIQDLSPLG